MQKTKSTEAKSSFHLNTNFAAAASAAGFVVTTFLTVVWTEATAEASVAEAAVAAEAAAPAAAASVSK